MTKSFDELFREEEAAREAVARSEQADPAYIAREAADKARRMAEIEREKAAGLRDADGNWTGPAEPESDEDEADEEESEDE